MSLPRFFLENQVLAAETEAVFPLRLAADDARHAKVLRLAAGEHIAVIDAAQDYFECVIADFSDGLPLVSIARHDDGGVSGPQVVLLQGLAKGDKMETVIRHATEVGVAAFVPLACARSVVKLAGKKAATKTERRHAIGPAPHPRGERAGGREGGGRDDSGRHLRARVLGGGARDGAPFRGGAGRPRRNPHTGG